jgi:hypothetical protein
MFVADAVYTRRYKLRRWGPDEHACSSALLFSPHLPTPSRLPDSDFRAAVSTSPSMPHTVPSASCVWGATGRGSVRVPACNSAACVMPAMPMPEDAMTNGHFYNKPAQEENMVAGLPNHGLRLMIA